MRIQRLDPTLANQIAAGEVVERPASVLKELLENGVDAGAGRIDVEVERGGAKLVRVRDDGAGIHRDDLVLALRRHATSKIRRFEDLRQIESLGFRGEALPSIASVSRLTLVSRSVDAESGWKVEAAGSAEVSEPVPAAHAPGTTVTVRDLFFNTPARRKFLRTEKTEFRHLETMVRVLALGHPGLDLGLVHNARPVFRVRAAESGQERDARVARLCGRRFAEHALRVEFESTGLALRGWVAGPGLDPRPSDPQHLFVNGRAVRDPVIRHAVRAACAEWLGADRQPGYILDLVLPAAEVDVNVHPTKHEVRFQDARLVHDFVMRGLRELGGASLLPPGPPATPAAPPLPSPRPAAPRPAGSGAGVAEAPSPYRRPASPTGKGEPGAAAASPAAPGEAVVGPLGGRYAAIAAGGRLRLVDVAAARREALIARLQETAAEGPVRSRPFLVPESCALDAGEAERFEAHEALLLRLGFEFRRVGPERIMLREAPIALAGIAARELVAALAAGLPVPDAGAGGDPARILIRRVVEKLVLPIDWPGVGTLLHELDAWSAASEPPSRGVWVELSGDAVAALFDAADHP